MKQNKTTTNIIKKARKGFSKLIENYIVPAVELIGAIVGAVLLAGLAYRGAANYLTNLSDDAKNIAAAVVVSLLVYAVIVGIKRIK